MKKGMLVFMTILFMITLTIGSIRVFAGQYPNVNKALCEKYLNLSNQALNNNNLILAKLFAMKAIQSDVFNKIAWQKYNIIVVKMSGGNISNAGGFSATQTQQTPAPQSSMPKAPSGGSAFQGC